MENQTGKTNANRVFQVLFKIAVITYFATTMWHFFTGNMFFGLELEVPVQSVRVLTGAFSAWGFNKKRQVFVAWITAIATLTIIPSLLQTLQGY